MVDLRGCSWVIVTGLNCFKQFPCLRPTGFTRQSQHRPSGGPTRPASQCRYPVESGSIG